MIRDSGPLAPATVREIEEGSNYTTYLAPPIGRRPITDAARQETRMFMINITVYQ